MSAPATVEADWSRLDRRMLLVHPVTELVKFVPVLIGAMVIGSSSGNPVWTLIPLVAIVAMALTRWFTTTYRIDDSHVELRTGLLQRRTLSVPRSRIRSVDIEADLLHRLLGLAVMVIGTGQQAEAGEKFRLDSLDQRVAPRLREALLAHLAGPPDVPSTPGEPARARAEGHEIAHWQPAWVRYAPLSLTGFAVVAPIVGLAFQYGLGEVVFRSDAAHSLEDRGAVVLALLVAALAVAVVAVVSLAACARYLTTWHGLRVLDDGHTLHLRHGLFTTRQITLDLARFRGATVKEPLLLRWAGAAELEAIMVGENARQKLLPQSPRAATERTLTELLGSRAVLSGSATPVDHQIAPATSASAPTSPEPAIVAEVPPRSADRPYLLPGSPSAPGESHAPGGHITTGPVPSGATTPLQLSVPLVAHGPIARRRRYLRALAPVGVVAVALAVLTLANVDVPQWWWLVPVLAAPVAAALAEDRYRGLGHAVIPATATGPAWLITRAGSLDRARDCLAGPGIIGWTVRQTYWQRRAGIATLVAATAAGKKFYTVGDIPLADAYTVIDTVTPGQLGHR